MSCHAEFYQHLTLQVIYKMREVLDILHLILYKTALKCLSLSKGNRLDTGHFN